MQKNLPGASCSGLVTSRFNFSDLSIFVARMNIRKIKKKARQTHRLKFKSNPATLVSEFPSLYRLSPLLHIHITSLYKKKTKSKSLASSSAPIANRSPYPKTKNHIHTLVSHEKKKKTRQQKEIIVKRKKKVVQLH